MVQPGDRVRITGVMPNDPNPIPIGTEGTVREVHEDVGQIHVDWDPDPVTRRSRGLILLTTDPFVVVDP